MTGSEGMMIGIGLVCCMIGAMQATWIQAMRFNRKLTRHKVDLQAWYEDQGDQHPQVLPWTRREGA